MADVFGSKILVTSIGGGGGGINKYTSFATLPLTAALGDLAITDDTLTIYAWNGSAWVVEATTGSDIATINGDATSAQTITIGTTGTDIAIVDNASGDHKINIPTASAANRGALSTTDWSTFNGKQESLVTATVDKVQLNAAIAKPAWAEGRVFYDQTEKALSYYNEVNGITVNLGQEQHIRVRNATGALIPNGSVGYVISAGSNLPHIALARADALATSEGVIGVVTHDIADNSNGYATTLGLIHDLNTNALNEGDPLYLSPSTAGAYTTTRPTGSNYVVRIGVVTKKDATTGHFLVYPQQLGIATLPVASGGTGAATAPLARIALGTQPVFNGLEDATKFTISYNSTTRIFTITVASGGAYTVGGVRYVPTPGVFTTTAHATTQGTWFCYYATGGALTVSQTVWDLLTTAPIIAAYYNAATPSRSIYFDERHGGVDGMDNSVHKNLHLTRGTQVLPQSPLGITVIGYTLNTSGAAALNWSATSGTLVDEDISIAAAAVLGTDLKQVWYLAASGRWDYLTDVDGFLDNGTDIYYNLFSAGSWSASPITTNNRWVNYWIVSTTTIGSPQTFVIMGQALHLSLAAAQASTFSSEIVNFNQLSGEGVCVYQMTYQRGSYGAPGNARLVAVTRTNQSILGGGSAGALSAGTVSADTTNFNGLLTASETNVQLALDRIDDYASCLVTTKDVDYTILVNDFYIRSGTLTASRTYTLPAASTVIGKRVCIKKTDATAFTVTIARTGSDLIDGSISRVIYALNDSFTLIAAASGVWEII